MTTVVYRLAMVRGNVLSGPFSGSLGNWWRTPREVASCVASSHTAPAAGCQCGIWASPSIPALTQFIRDWRSFDDRRVKQLASALRGATRDEIQDALEEVHAAPAYRHLCDIRPDVLLTMARDMRWENLAVVRADAEGPEYGMYDREPGLWPGNHVYLANLSGALNVGLHDAQRWSAKLNHPEGFRRYHAATITGIWLDSGWADYVDELVERYQCPVRPVRRPSGRHDWISNFELGGVLPGHRPNPDPAIIKAVMSGLTRR